LYQPAGLSFSIGGTWTVPSAASPSGITEVSTPMAGICSRTGAERAIPPADVEVPADEVPDVPPAGPLDVPPADPLAVAAAGFVPVPPAFLPGPPADVLEPAAQPEANRRAATTAGHPRVQARRKISPGP
jgi:hypothetical protein